MSGSSSALALVCLDRPASVFIIWPLLEWKQHSAYIHWITDLNPSYTNTWCMWTMMSSLQRGIGRVARQHVYYDCIIIMVFQWVVYDVLSKTNLVFYLLRSGNTSMKGFWWFNFSFTITWFIHWATLMASFAPTSRRSRRWVTRSTSRSRHVSLIDWKVYGIS